MSTLKVNQWLNLDGTENYKTRAWVNFNGTGTVAIRASGNVSSITDNGVGDYTINFATAFADTNYSINYCGQLDTSGSTPAYSLIGINRTAGSVLTTSVRINTCTTAPSTFDYTIVNVAVLR